MNVALNVRHSLSGELKGEFFRIISEVLKSHAVFLTKNAAKLVKNHPEYSQLPVIKNCTSDDIDLLIFFGGDGTLLRTINRLAPSIFSVDIFGINAGNIGFFSSLELENIREGLDNVFSKKYSKDPRMVLEGEIRDVHGGVLKTFYALNECTIHHEGIARLRKLDVSVSEEFLSTYKADGLIIATPTGSTAYNMAAGGPIVAAGLDAFIVTPLAPSGFSQRPIILPSHKELKISIDAQMLVSIDGQEYFSLQENQILYIKKHAHPLTFLRLGHENYYKNLREKLGWGT